MYSLVLWNNFQQQQQKNFYNSIFSAQFLIHILCTSNFTTQLLPLNFFVIKNSAQILESLWMLPRMEPGLFWYAWLSLQGTFLVVV